ncbi:hypothetical protein DFH09DRAFT_1467542 [Mycena vulgaris]|nr:hypothetical protein DFH09DRAFT_1467542 [Mycena vulgaris]
MHIPTLQASLIGSILINILLVLGSAFFTCGVTFSAFGFGATHSQLTMSLLMLGAVAVVIPTAFFGLGTAVPTDQERAAILRISRAMSVILLFCYIMFLAFQFYLSTGSSVNLALFIQPILVLLAWPMQKNLSLLYDPFESLTLFLSVIIVNHSLSTGKNLWLSGVILIGLYIIIATSFWFYVSYMFLTPSEVHGNGIYRVAPEIL